jgi:hypothetical protein
MPQGPSMLQRAKTIASCEKQQQRVRNKRREMIHRHTAAFFFLRTVSGSRIPPLSVKYRSMGEFLKRRKVRRNEIMNNGKN